MAELLRYSPVAKYDFETFEAALAQCPEEEGVFCDKC